MNQNLNLKQQLRCIYISDFFLRPAHHGCGMGGPAGGPGLLPVGDRPGRKRVSHRQPLLRSAQRMAADLLGRRKTLLSGGVLTVTCNLLMAFAPNLFTICLAMG